MNGATTDGELQAFDSLDDINKWILTRLDETVSDVDAYLEKFEFAKACELIYHFAWDDLCDWYLELTKSSFAKGGAEAASTQRVLGHVLDQLLRLMHPVMPFITEELWCNLTGNETLVTSAWPKFDPSQRDEASLAAVAKVQEIVTEIRRFRNDQGIKTSARIVARFNGMDASGLASYEDAIRFIVRCDKAEGNFTSKVDVAGITVEFDLSGAVDVKAERARLTKDLAAAEKDRNTAKVKIENEGFMAKAPMEVVQEIRQRLADTTADIERITAALAALPAE
jgi:valyl-tRNA synthetase